ncbi:unnamed protein product [Alternaria alternata]
MGQVQLYCPSKKKTVDNFVFGAFQNLDQVLQGVRLALDIKYAALYTVEARPIYEPSALEDDQRILVAASAEVTMLPDAPPGWVLYHGEEGDDVDPDTEGYGQEWDTLSDHEKYLHITSLNEQKPETRNKMRITRPYKSLEAELHFFEYKGSSTVEFTEDDARVERYWGITVKQFIPFSMKAGPSTNLSQKLTSPTAFAIMILSSFTHGQSRLALEVLEEAIALRTQDEQGDNKDPVLQTQDVLNAIAIVYERADLIPAKLTKVKSGKSKEREKRKAAREKKKSAAIWFTTNLTKISHSDRETYVRMLRTKPEESVKERNSLDQQAALIISLVEEPVEALKQQDEPNEEELKHAKKVADDTKRRIMIDRLVHDAKHEGLEALLSKAEYTIWGQVE